MKQTVQKLVPCNAATLKSVLVLSCLVLLLSGCAVYQPYGYTDGYYSHSDDYYAGGYYDDGYYSPGNAHYGVSVGYAGYRPDAYYYPYASLDYFYSAGYGYAPGFSVAYSTPYLGIGYYVPYRYGNYGRFGHFGYNYRYNRFGYPARRGYYAGNHFYGGYRGGHRGRHAYAGGRRGFHRDGYRGHRGRGDRGYRERNFRAGSGRQNSSGQPNRRGNDRRNNQSSRQHNLADRLAYQRDRDVRRNPQRESGQQFGRSNPVSALPQYRQRRPADRRAPGYLSQDRFNRERGAGNDRSGSNQRAGRQSLAGTRSRSVPDRPARAGGEYRARSGQRSERRAGRLANSYADRARRVTPPAQQQRRTDSRVPDSRANRRPADQQRVRPQRRPSQPASRPRPVEKSQPPRSSRRHDGADKGSQKGSRSTRANSGLRRQQRRDRD